MRFVYFFVIGVVAATTTALTLGYCVDDIKDRWAYFALITCVAILSLCSAWANLIRRIINTARREELEDTATLRIYIVFLSRTALLAILALFILALWQIFERPTNSTILDLNGTFISLLYALHDTLQDMHGIQHNVVNPQNNIANVPNQPQALSIGEQVPPHFCHLYLHIIVMC
ncbi:hypothetical protein Ddc_11066 [Ditylenchus destructor]|nr:hypothetical protein Ddc_11066 [Ditylenchus destructor]